MSRSVGSVHSLVRPRVAILALVGVALAGCSNSGRFDTPYPTASNTRSYPRSEVTGSIAQHRAPVSHVASQPLPAPSRPATVASSSLPPSGGYHPGTYRNSDITGSVQSPAQPRGHWTWDGGAPVTVGRNDTVETIARKYGVPASAIMETNGITSSSQIRAGQRLVIPRYVASGAAPSRAAATPQVAAAAPSSENVHVVAPGETLMSISRRYHVSLSTLAHHNNIQASARLGIGDRIAIPGTQRASAPMQRGPAMAAAPAPRMVAAQPMPQQQMQQQAAPQLAQPRTVPAAQIAAAPAPAQIRMATQEKPTTATAATAAEPAGNTMPSFRWPVRGHVIAAFGPKPNGTTNDGINLAVPEGTPIKAADDGVVAYAGNELKGYGNLVLIRHANGFVSAYANASELLVKRGDSIKRGQVIAHAGQTGNVTSPQLHFEIRKGSTPVDPTKYLSGA